MAYVGEDFRFYPQKYSEWQAPDLIETLSPTHGRKHSPHPQCYTYAGSPKHHGNISNRRYPGYLDCDCNCGGVIHACDDACIYKNSPYNFDTAFGEHPSGHTCDSRPFILHKIVRKDVPAVKCDERVTYSRERYRVNPSELQDCTHASIADILSQRGHRCPDMNCVSDKIAKLKIDKEQGIYSDNDKSTCCKIEREYLSNSTMDEGKFEMDHSQKAKYVYYGEDLAGSPRNELGIQARGLHAEIEDLMTRLLQDSDVELDSKNAPLKSCLKAPKDSKIDSKKTEKSQVTFATNNSKEQNGPNPESDTQGEQHIEGLEHSDNPIVKPNAVAWDINESYLKQEEERILMERQKREEQHQMQKRIHNGPTLQDYYKRWVSQREMRGIQNVQHRPPSVHRFCKEPSFDDGTHVSCCYKPRQHTIHVKGTLDTNTGHVKLSTENGNLASQPNPSQINTIQGHQVLQDGSQRSNDENKVVDLQKAFGQIANATDNNLQGSQDGSNLSRTSSLNSNSDMTEEQKRMYKNDSYYAQDNPMQFATPLANVIVHDASGEPPSNFSHPFGLYANKFGMSPTYSLSGLSPTQENTSKPECHHHYHYYKCSKHKHHHHHRRHHNCTKHKEDCSKTKEHICKKHKHTCSKKVQQPETKQELVPKEESPKMQTIVHPPPITIQSTPLPNITIPKEPQRLQMAPVQSPTLSPASSVSRSPTSVKIRYNVFRRRKSPQRSNRPQPTYCCGARPAQPNDRSQTANASYFYSEAENSEQFTFRDDMEPPARQHSSPIIMY
ncbi:hypothetical protein BdWA1_002928 [Babesia duncani]|uniref:Uncharacterized protein n=1 Tax=Babesia duncani TaxID=323732 RepID=A0AAD9PIC2_9APIC|nr:hypothetical protein BdWA1_002928 [Babesia duncani]